MAGLAEFDAVRNKVKREQAAYGQTAQDALDRRFARLGGLNSGAYIKQSQVLGNDINQQTQNALSDVNLQEIAEKRRLAELDTNRKFATSEREASQQFASGERLGSQGFATSERLGSQGFASQEQEKARQQQADQFQKQFGLQQAGFEVDKAAKLQSMQLDKEQFALDKDTTEYNKLMSTMSLPGDQAVGGVLAIISDPKASPGAKAAAELMAWRLQIHPQQIKEAQTEGGVISRYSWQLK